MKKSIIVLNILLFVAGNLFTPAIHNICHHHSNNDIHESDECLDCIVFTNSKYFFSNFDYSFNPGDNEDFFLLDSSSYISFTFKKEYPPRAPPLS